MRKESGQMLLIAVMILLVLMISIPAVIFVNSRTTRTSVASQKGLESTEVTKEGLAYAMHALSISSITWNEALKDNFPTEFGPVFNPNEYTAASGGVFTIKSYTGNTPEFPATVYTVQPYEVQVLVQGKTAGVSAGQAGHSRALRAVVAAKTLAAVLPAEVRASAAFVTGHTPPWTSAGLAVHWGPVVISSDTTPWLVRTAMDQSQFPRKFSSGGIKGSVHPSMGSFNIDPQCAACTGNCSGECSYPRSYSDLEHKTDGKEYWAESSLGFPNVINTEVYISTARVTALLKPSGAPMDRPVTKSSGFNRDPILPHASCVEANCAYFDVGVDTAVFDSNYIYAVSSGVIYVNGNAEFNDIYIDLRRGTPGIAPFATGAFIVTGNLTLNTHGTGLKLISRVPPTANSEYPYFPTNPTSWPCSGQWTSAGGACCSDTTQLGGGDTNGMGTGGGNGLVQFRGFLYVKGNLVVNTPGWLMAGAVRVDGTVDVPVEPPTTSWAPRLAVLYDDYVNHHIAVTPTELMVDYLKEAGVQ